MKKEKKKKALSRSAERSRGKKPAGRKTRKNREMSRGGVWSTDFGLKSLIEKEKEIMRTEEALVESMRRFRDLFEQSPIGIGIHDTSGELLIVNKAYLEVFGVPSFGKISEQNIFKGGHLPPDEVRAIRAGRTIQCEKEHDFAKEGSFSSREDTGYVLYTVSPLLREDVIIGYMVQVQDITQRKKIAESQRLAQLGRLLSDMAHEVNNPLMIISGRAELALLDDARDEKIKEVLKIILDQCFLAKDIIQRLLKYSRIGKIGREAVDVGKTLELITEILNHHFKLADVTIKKDIPSELPYVRGSEKQLQEVFINILRNAADAMPQGGVIDIKVRRRGNTVKIDIKDTGEGMDEKVLNKIFEPFFTTKQKGTGLGMAVCHTIIQDHNGDLQYKSKVGSGTTATIMLPAME